MWMWASRGPADRVVDRGMFINYRDEDTHSYGALLYTELARQFGADRVFLDAESIPAGADFVQELLRRVRSAQVLLAVIGPRWLTATDPTDPTGRRRIDDPADWVRRELAEAFTAGVRVIPVLTDQAQMPAEAELPADIAALSRCQYRHLRHHEPTTDLARLVADLTNLGFGPVRRSPTSRPR
jgi:TIR domain